MPPSANEPSRDRLSPVDIQTIHEDGVVVLRLSGELDSDNADALYQALRDDTRNHPGPLVLDMSGVSFIDSTILSRLLQLRTESVDGGSSLLVRNPSPVVRRVFEITGLDEVFGLS
jgi:anti-sigma B factor antagonist